MNKLCLWTVILFSFAVFADDPGLSFSSGQYVIQGYRKQTVVGGKKEEVKAKVSKGFPTSDFEDASEVDFKLTAQDFTLQISSLRALIKNDEAIFVGGIHVDLRHNGKSLWTYAAPNKDDRLQLTLSDMTIRSSGGTMTLGKDSYVGGSVNVRLERGLVFWPSGTVKNGAAKASGPLRITSPLQ